MPRVGCVSSLLHFLGIFTYISAEQQTIQTEQPSHQDLRSLQFFYCFTEIPVYSDKCVQIQNLDHWLYTWKSLIILCGYTAWYVFTGRRCPITKTNLYNFDPLKPHFYIVKLGFTGVYIIFLISAQNIDCGYSLEPPRRGGSNGYPQSMFWAEI